MKKLLAGSFLILLLASCSTDSDVPIEETPETLKVELEASSLSLEVDEVATIEVESDAPLSEVAWIAENFTRSTTALTGTVLPGDLELYFQFADPGIYPVHLEFTGINGVTVSKDLQFEVRRGNTVQITGIRVNNFYEMGQTWDLEFAEDDPERLADIVFALEKRRHSNFVKKEFHTGLWYLSKIHKNESSLTWDLSDEQLFLDPQFGFYFGLEDLDDGNISQNLMLDYPSRVVELRNEIENRPASIDLIDESVDLDVTIFLDWP